MSQEPDAEQLENLKFELQIKLEREKLKNNVRLEEYKSIRSEMNDRAKEKYRFQSAAMIGSVIYYGWLISRYHGLNCVSIRHSHIIQTFAQYVPWAVPVCLTCLAIWRVYRDGTDSKRIAEYLRLYESTFKGGEDGATNSYPMWETYVHGRRIERLRKDRLARWKSHDLAFWVFLLMVMIVMAVVGPIIAPAYCDQP